MIMSVVYNRRKYCYLEKNLQIQQITNARYGVDCQRTFSLFPYQIIPER